MLQTQKNKLVRPAHHKQGGFLVLTMVLLVSAIVLAVSTGIYLRSISVVAETADQESATKAWSVVNACGEYALIQMASTTGEGNWDYAGDESLSVGEETCYINPVGEAGSAKVIQAFSTVGAFTKKIEIEVATNTPSIIINYWTAVSDF